MSVLTHRVLPPVAATTHLSGVETTQLYFVPCGPHETRYIANLGQPVNKKMPEFVTDARAAVSLCFRCLVVLLGRLAHPVDLSRISWWRYPQEEPL